MARQISANVPNMDVVMTLVENAKLYFVMLEACKLELFDELDKAPQTAIGLAKVKGWQLDPLRRLMDSAVSLKLLNRSTDRGGQEVYENTESGRLLIAHGPPNLFEYVTFAKEDISGIGRTADVIRKGGEGVEADESSVDDFFGDMAPEMIRGMYRMLEGTGRPYADRLVTATDLARHQTVVDLGGGTGVYTQALLRAYPHMKVTLFEMPPAIKHVKEEYIPENGDPRITLLGGDFFKDPLPKADLYVIGNVLHGYEPEKCRQLLRLVNASVNAGGAVLVMAQLLNDDRKGPASTHAWDLAFYGNGRMYTGSDYAAMLADTGFGEAEIVWTQEDWACDIVYAPKR